MARREGHTGPALDSPGEGRQLIDYLADRLERPHMMSTVRPDRKFARLALVLLYLTGAAVLPLVHLLETAGLPPAVAYAGPADDAPVLRGHSDDSCVVCRAFSQREHLPSALAQPSDALQQWTTTLFTATISPPASPPHVFPQSRAPPIGS